jgi:hypothetical protein
MGGWGGERVRRIKILFIAVKYWCWVMQVGCDEVYKVQVDNMRFGSWLKI